MADSFPGELFGKLSDASEIRGDEVPSGDWKARAQQSAPLGQSGSKKCITEAITNCQANTTKLPMLKTHKVPFKGTPCHNNKKNVRDLRVQ